MAKEKILVIEDAKNILELVRYNLEQSGFSVSTARKGNEGLEKAAREKPSLIILDIMLPEMDGFEVCKFLKKNEKTSNIPILMLTAKSAETDKVLGLELGADDYVTKPFSPRELIARAKAILRRSKPRPSICRLKSGSIELDAERHIVSLKGKPLELTHKEFKLLKALMSSDGRVLSREYLLNHVWGYEESLNIETRTVDMHVGQIRRKLKSEGSRILTVKNEGYRFDSEL